MRETIDRLFSQSDLERISAAVREAEQETSGEIVPYFSDSSDRYEEAVWRGSAFIAFLVLGGFASFQLFTDMWLSVTVVELAVTTVATASAGALVVHLVPSVKRFFAGRALLDYRVTARATEAFLSEEVFQTRQRTGILIFLSLLEHKVIVIGDKGIREKVKQSDWEDVIARIVKGLRNQRPTEGLIDAIHQCGVVLRESGFRRRPEDTDELSNKPRIRPKRKKDR